MDLSCITSNTPPPILSSSSLWNPLQSTLFSLSSFSFFQPRRIRADISRETTEKNPYLKPSLFVTVRVTDGGGGLLSIAVMREDLLWLTFCPLCVCEYYTSVYSHVCLCCVIWRWSEDPPLSLMGICEWNLSGHRNFGLWTWERCDGGISLFFSFFSHISTILPSDCGAHTKQVNGSGSTFETESLAMTTKDGLCDLAWTTWVLSLWYECKKNRLFFLTMHLWAIVAQTGFLLHFALQSQRWELEPSGSGFIILVIGAALLPEQQR